MTSIAWLALAAAAVAAAVDWWAVASRNKDIEYVAKPAALTALVVCALALDPTDEARRAYFAFALVLSLAGDVFLMLRRDMFVAGLASFFVAHLAYIGGFVTEGIEPLVFLIAAAVLSVLAAVLITPVVRALRADKPSLVAPVFAYATVITAMVAAAIAHGNALAVAGALLFYASDFLIARTRFVADLPWGKLAIIVTYHLGQVALVLSLVT